MTDNIDQIIPPTPEEIALQAQVDGATKQLVQMFEKAYMEFLAQIARIPIDPNSRSLANQFFDTGSLWCVNGIKRAVGSSIAATQPTPPEPSAPSADAPNQPVADEVDAA